MSHHLTFLNSRQFKINYKVSDSQAHSKIRKYALKEKSAAVAMV